MDSASLYSTCHSTCTASMTDSIIEFEASWLLSRFLTPACIPADQALNNDVFNNCQRERGITLRPVPPPRHHKNPLKIELSSVLHT